MDEAANASDALRDIAVLYVEDEAEVREGLARFLRRRFSRVDLAENGVVGLEMFAGGRYDAVVTDVKMPLMDGLEMAEKIKSLQRDVPVIVVTAYNEIDYLLRAIEIKVDRYVKKPVDPNELVDAIREAARVRWQQRELERLLERELETMERMVGALARAIEKRDPFTDGHQRQVADLAVSIADELGLPSDTVTGIRFAALIHDVGSIQIPSEMLSTPRKLGPVEMEFVRAHPKAGLEIVGDIDFPWPIGEIIFQHHERLDGSGYPLGLKGEAIRLEARILGVADVVDAMASHRPYRPALGVAAAIDELQRGRGKLYDPAVVDACLAALRAGHRAEHWKE